MFPEIIITDEMRIKAKKMANDLGKLNNSIRNGTGNLTGFLGELCVVEYLGETTKHEGKYSHDLIYNNMRLEIKTKDRTVIPSSKYEVSIANFNTTQDTDYYFFVSLLREGEIYVKGYLVGYLSKTEFFEKARKVTKGDKDETNGWIASADCWNVLIKDLDQFQEVA